MSKAEIVKELVELIKAQNFSLFSSDKFGLNFESTKRELLVKLDDNDIKGFEKDFEHNVKTPTDQSTWNSVMEPFFNEVGSLIKSYYKSSSVKSA